MIIESVTELELLGAAHEAFFDENNRRHDKSVLGQTLIGCFRNSKRASYVNQAITSLHNKGVFIAKKSNLKGVDEAEYGLIELTEMGEKAAKSVVEPYWVYSPWTTKYPGMRELLIPEFTESVDWDIIKVLYENVSWLDDFKIDENRAADLIDKVMEPPAFQRFIDKVRYQHRCLSTGHGTDEKGQHVEMLMLQPRCKPIVISDFSFLKTIQTYFKAMTKMSRRARKMNATSKEFIDLLMEYHDGERPDPEKFFEHLACGEVIHINPYVGEDKTKDIRVTMQGSVGSSEWPEWENHYLRTYLNPQSNYYHLSDQSTVEFNERTNELRFRNVKPRKTPFDGVMTSLDALSGGSQEEAVGEEIFIVHGHDIEFLKEVRQLIEDADLSGIVLHDLPNEGRTLIEKLEKHSENVGFAVVLLTPDDTCISEGEETKRARQNVIFELGFFLRAVGRGRVCTIYKKGVELPSDYHGVGYVPVDSKGRWKRELLREIKAAGFQVNEKALPENV